MQLLTILALAAIGFSEAYAINYGNITTFEQFKQVFNRKYDSFEEEAIRRANFEASLAWVRKNNGKNGMTYGINELSDLSNEEFYAMNKATRPVNKTESYYQYIRINADPNAPENFDWRASNPFGPIENQGRCGSCWAYAAVTVIEAVHSLKHHSFERLSKQQLLDCTYRVTHPEYRNIGCTGGFPSEAFRYTVEHGLVPESSYPYLGQVSQCGAGLVMNQPHTKLTNYIQLMPNSPDGEIMAALKYYGPLTITIHANFEEFRHYQGNVIMNWFPNSPPQANDHAIVLVGWGRTPQGYDYWIIRNSYGPSWGAQGYGYIMRGGNYMGINNGEIAGAVMA